MSVFSNVNRSIAFRNLNPATAFTGGYTSPAQATGPRQQADQSRWDQYHLQKDAFFAAHPDQHPNTAPTPEQWTAQNTAPGANAAQGAAPGTDGSGVANQGAGPQPAGAAANTAYPAGPTAPTAHAQPSPILAALQGQGSPRPGEQNFMSALLAALHGQH